MSDSRLQQISGAIEQLIQDNTLSIDQSTPGLPELTEALSLLTGETLVLSGVSLSLSDTALTLSGQWDGSGSLPALGGIALPVLDLVLTIESESDGEGPRITFEASGPPSGELQPLTLASLIAGFIPAGMALPAEVAGLDQLALSGFLGSFNFSTKEYSFASQATLATLTLGALSVANAAGSVEITGTGSTLANAKVTLSAEYHQELVPALQVDSVSLVLELSRTETGAWQWQVGGSLVVGLFDLPKQTLYADASNGQFRFSVQSDPPLTWSLPDAADSLSLSFTSLALSLSREAATNQYSWAFEGKGGIKLAELPALHGTLGLHYGTEQSGFIFTADEDQGTLSLSLPLVPDNERMNLGCAVRADSLSLIKQTEWTLSCTSSLSITVPEPESTNADSTDPIDQALSLLGEMFQDPMTATLTVQKSGAELVVDGLPQPPVTIPVLVDDQIVWDKKGSVGLSRLELRLGTKLSAKGQLRLKFPSEINNIFGQVDRKPKTNVLNTEWLFSISYDDQLGLSLQVDSFPINLAATEYIRDEVDGDRTWKRFTLGDIVTFRFGSFADASTGVKWTHVDFGALGEVRFLPPSFLFNGTDFSAKGGFDIIRDLHIPTAPVRWLLKQCKLDDLANLLPGSIAPLNIHLLSPDGHTFDADGFVATVRTLAQTMNLDLPGLPELTDLKQVVSALAGQFNQLPEDLRGYLDITLPSRLEFDIAVTPAAGFGIKLDISAPNEPLKLLIPTTDLLFTTSPVPVPALYGLTIRKLSFGEVIEGALLLVAADVDIDYFDLFSLAASLSLPASVSDKFTSTPSIQKKLVLNNFLCLVVYQTAIPIPIPIYFDAVGFKYFGLEGLRSQLMLNNNLAGLTLGRLLKGLADLYKELRKFFKDGTYALPEDLFSRNGLNPGISIKPGFVQLPKYLGEGLLGSKQELPNLGLEQLLVPLVNYLKDPDPGKLLSIIPLDDRNGDSTEACALQLGPFKPQASWLLCTTQEFESLSAGGAESSSAFVKSLYAEGATQGTESVELLNQLKQVKRVPGASGTDHVHEGVIFYAQGGMQLQGVDTKLYAHAGFFADRDRGLFTQFRIKGKAGPIVEMELGGSFAVPRQAPGQNVQSSADLRLAGDVKLIVLGHQALAASLALQNGVFTFTSQLSLFPPPPDCAFQANASVTGAISDQSLHIAGNATLALAPLPAVQAYLVVTQQRTTLQLSWLNQDWLLELREQNQGQYLLRATANQPVAVLPQLVSVLDATNDARGPELSLVGPSAPKAALSGRVRIEKFEFTGAGSLMISPQQVNAVLSNKFHGWNSTLSVEGNALDQPASFSFKASFDQDLFTALAEKLKDGFELLRQTISNALDDAHAMFEKEWAKLKKLVQEGASALRAGLLDAKAKIEKLLGELDGMVKETIAWIGVKDEEIAARQQFLDGLSAGARNTVKWFQDRVAELQQKLDGKNGEIRGLDTWYNGLDGDGRFWNWLYYSGRRVQLLIERDVLPPLLQIAQNELSRAQDGIQQARQTVDQVLSELDRVRRGFADELSGYQEAILAKKAELDKYNEHLAKSAEQLLADLGQAIDSTARDAAKKVYEGAKTLNDKMSEALSRVTQNVTSGLPLEVLRLEISGGLSEQTGTTFSAIGDIKLNFFATPKVVQDFVFSVDLKNPTETMKSLARALWENRDELKLVDSASYVPRRDAQLLPEYTSFRELRATQGANFGESVEKKLLQEQDWKELAAFYDYAVANTARFPALGDAVAVLSRFDRLLSEYQAAEVAYRSWNASFEVLRKLPNAPLYDLRDPTIAVKHAKRSLLDEVARLYKAEFLRRATDGSSLEGIAVDVPEDPAVCLFSGSVFSGNVQRLGPGRYDQGELSVGNDTVKSVWVKPGYRLTLYEHAGFQGESRQIESDATYLAEFDRRTSSVVVECIAFTPPNISAWARDLPGLMSLVWAPGFRVRYAIAYEYADGSTDRSGWWTPSSAQGSVSADGYLSHSAYGCPILSGISCDPTNRAVARRIYRQFYSLPERMIHRIPNNTDTEWVDLDMGIKDHPVSPPQVSIWAANLPVAGSPVWRAGYKVRYAIAYELADGSLHRSGWWHPTSGGVSADAHGYISTDYACPSLIGIPVDPTGSAVARRIYRQFRGRPERMIHRIPNNTDTTWIDDDKGIRDQPLAPPELLRWAAPLPIPDRSLWRPGYAVRYAIAYEFADGSQQRSAWWNPSGSVVPAEPDGYVKSEQGCAVLKDLACDGTNQAVARVIYRQFRGQPESVIHRFTNNTETTWTDASLEGADTFILGTDKNVYKWDGASWTQFGGSGTRLAVGPTGQVFLLNASAGNSIWRRDGNGWTQLPGAALDIAIGADGSLFVLGTDNNLYKWNGSDWDPLGGTGTRIAVGPTGQVFLLNASAGNSIWRRDGSDWTGLPGAALDIAIGADGSLYVLGTGRDVYKWNGTNWDPLKGKGTRIAVGPTGQVFLLDGNDKNAIWCRAGDGWTRLPGQALEIAAGGLPPAAQPVAAAAPVQQTKALRKTLPKKIALRASNGQYVSAQGNDQLLLASRTTPGANECFVSISAGFGKFGLLAPSGKYVCPTSSSDPRLTPSVYAVTAAESLTVHDRGDDRVSLQAANGLYVQAVGGGSGAVSAIAPQLHAAERFEIVDISNTDLANFALRGTSTLVLGTDNNIYKWDGSSWNPLGGSGTRLVVDPTGQVFLLNANAGNSIWRREGNSWTQLPGAALDLAISEDGSLFILGTDRNLYQWNSSTWIQVGGSGTRVAVDPTGQVFLLNANAGNSIWRREGSSWTQLPGAALDLSIGADGSMYILGTDHQVYKWTGAAWVGLGGSGTRIAAGPFGQLVVLNASADNTIWSRAGDEWERLSGQALDIVVSPIRM